MPGTLEQLILGLLICFLSFGAYMLASPYLELKHDYVSRLCQAQIFFALLAGIVLKAEPTESTVDNFGLILTFLCVLPPLAIAVLVSPYSTYVTDADARSSALATLASAARGLRRCCAGAKETRQRSGRIAPNIGTSSTKGRASPGALARAFSTRSDLLRRDPDARCADVGAFNPRCKGCAACGVCAACKGFADRAADKARSLCMLM